MKLTIGLQQTLLLSSK